MLEKAEIKGRFFFREIHWKSYRRNWIFYNFISISRPKNIIWINYSKEILKLFFFNYYFFKLPSPRLISFVYPYNRAFFSIVLVVPPYKVTQNISFALEVTAVKTDLEVYCYIALELVD